MSEVQVVPFGALLAYPLRSGVTVPKERRGSGIKMINMGELFKYPMLRDVEMALVDIDYSDSDRYLVRNGDLLFARRSLTAEGAGQCAIVVEIDGRSTWESSIIRARLDKSRANPYYYYYFFRSSVGRAAVEGIVEQVAVAGIRSSDLRILEVPYPPLQQQNAVVSVLKALDDKIAVNERIADVALELGAAKFQLLYQSADEVVTVDDLVDLKYGKALPAMRRIPGDIPVFGSGGVSGSHIEPLVKGPGIVIGRKGTVGSVYWSAGDFYPIDTTFYVVCRNGEVTLEYMYFALKSLGLEGMNSDSAVPGLNRDRARSLALRIPVAEAMQGFTAEVRNLFELQRSREEENRTLATLRDTLLSQLMSGRLRVKDAEKIVEDAT